MLIEHLQPGDSLVFHPETIKAGIHVISPPLPCSFLPILSSTHQSLRPLVYSGMTGHIGRFTHRYGACRCSELGLSLFFVFLFFFSTRAAYLQRTVN